MAITMLSHLVLRSLRKLNALAEGVSMIEMGESNWYGDVSIAQLSQDIAQLVSDPARRDGLISELQSIADLARKKELAHGDALYRIAKVFFKGIGGCASIASIDPGTPGSEYKFDLNKPVPLEQRFGLVLNYGTGEHVFNVAQFYKTVHDLAEPGGLMVHSAPLAGWVDHGFYNFQPTFFVDLALANQYQVLIAVVAQLAPFKMIELTHREHVIELAKKGELPPNALIEVALRKPATHAEFVIPMQGYYAGALSPEAAQAWRTLR
jgi:SAM-dependent methyltransferase